MGGTGTSLFSVVVCLPGYLEKGCTSTSPFSSRIWCSLKVQFPSSSHIQVLGCTSTHPFQAGYDVIWKFNFQFPVAFRFLGCTSTSPFSSWILCNFNVNFPTFSDFDFRVVLVHPFFQTGNDEISMLFCQLSQI